MSIHKLDVEHLARSLNARRFSTRRAFSGTGTVALVAMDLFGEATA